MTPLVTLALIIFIPVLVLMFLRINAVLVFLSICLGDVLVQFVVPDSKTMITMFAGSNAHIAGLLTNNINIVLLLLPVALTAVFMIHTVHGGAKLILNLLPAIGAGLLATLLVVPLLSAGLRHNIIDSSLWTQVERAQDLIVGSSSVICLLVLWMQRPKKSGGGEGKHGKHSHGKE
jgi:hypothetical protein